jgi:hypothetical protein
MSTALSDPNTGMVPRTRSTAACVRLACGVWSDGPASGLSAAAEMLRSPMPPSRWMRWRGTHCALNSVLRSREALSLSRRSRSWSSQQAGCEPALFALRRKPFPAKTRPLIPIDRSATLPYGGCTPCEGWWLHLRPDHHSRSSAASGAGASSSGGRPFHQVGPTALIPHDRVAVA